MRSNEKKRKKKSVSEHREVGSMLQSALFGALCGMLSSLVLLFIVALICYRSPDPDALLSPLALGALFVSSFVSGFAALRRNRTSALLCGAAAGILLALFFLALSFFFVGKTEDALSPVLSWLIRAAMIPVAAVGGFAGLPRKKKRR